MSRKLHVHNIPEKNQEVECLMCRSYGIAAMENKETGLGEIGLMIGPRDGKVHRFFGLTLENARELRDELDSALKHIDNHFQPPPSAN